MASRTCGEMDTPAGAAAAAPGHDEIGDLLVHLEDARGRFSGTLLDYNIPCTASENSRCQIVASIPIWNEFLCWLELELRELSGGKLALVHVRKICCPRPTQGEVRQAAAILYVLLQTHSCVTSVHIPNYSDDSEIVHLWNAYPRTDGSVIADLCSPVLCTDDSERTNLCSAVLCNVLYGNHAVKSVTLKVPSRSLQMERFCNVLWSMKGLEELHCEVSSWDKLSSTTISALLRDSATLTVFDVIPPRIENAHSGLLVRALRANSTLRDLTLSYSDVAVEPQLFVAFMSSTVTLKHLKVVESRCAVEYDKLNRIFQRMLKNATVSSLEALELCDRGNGYLGAKMLAQKEVLRSFGLWHYSNVSINVSREKITAARDRINAFWIGALSKNNTLELMTLSVSILSNKHWGHFFRFLSRHDSLKMVTVDVAKHERDLLSDVVKKVREIGCEDKVSFMDSYGEYRFSLADWTNYSERRACLLAEDKCTARAVYEELSTYPPLTFLGLQMEWDKELGWLLVEFVSKMVTLKKLDLTFTGRGKTKLDDWWLALSQSLLHNRSIINFTLWIHFDKNSISLKGLECVGGTIARSKTIRKLRLLAIFKDVATIFLRGMSADISQNYSLCSACLFVPHEDHDSRSLWLVVANTARRNTGYVARAAQFMNRRRCDTPCAAALDRVYRNPALVAELSKVLSVSEVDAVVAVRQRFRSIEGMHEFMRLACVVKARVTCHPRDDGHAQLDALDEHCWAHVRRYLQLDDVAWHCRPL